MKNLLIIIVSVLLLSSCATQSRCDRKYPAKESTNIKDSTRIIDSTVFDTVKITKYYKIPVYETRDSVVIRHEKGQSMSDKLYLKGRYSEAVIYMQNNVLKGKLTESGWIAIQTDLIMSKRTIKEYQSKVSDKTIVVKERYIPVWVKRLAWVGGICSILLLLMIIAVVYTKITKIDINLFD